MDHFWPWGHIKDALEYSFKEVCNTATSSYYFFYERIHFYHTIFHFSIIIQINGDAVFVFIERKNNDQNSKILDYQFSVKPILLNDVVI